MPPKIFECMICGEEVTKPKSYAIGKGRACRHHHQSQQAHTGREVDRKLKALAEQRKQGKEPFAQAIHEHYRRNPKMQMKIDSEYMEIMQNPARCHLCRKEGISISNFWLRSAHILHDNKEALCDFLLGKQNKIMDAQREMVPDVVMIIEPPKKFPVKINQTLFEATQYGIVTAIQACGECRTKYKYDIHPDVKERLEKPPKVSLKGMMALGIAFENSIKDKS